MRQAQAGGWQLNSGSVGLPGHPVGRDRGGTALAAPRSPGRSLPGTPWEALRAE